MNVSSFNVKLFPLEISFLFDSILIKKIHTVFLTAVVFIIRLAFSLKILAREKVVFQEEAYYFRYGSR